MQSMTNYVVVKLHRSPDDLCVQTKSGLWLNGYFNQTWYTPTTGTVISVPRKLYFKAGDMQNSLEMKVRMELLAGDNIHFHYNAVENAIKQRGAYWKEGNEEFVSIRYDSIICALRDEICMVNGWMLVAPVEEKKEQGLIFQIKNKYAALAGVVKHSGSYADEYLWEKYNDVTHEGINAILPETLVIFKKFCEIELENSMIAELPNYYRIQQKDILAIIEDEIKPSYGKVFVDIEEKGFTAGGLEIPENFRKNKNVGTVTHSRIEGIEPGDQIIFKRNSETPIDHNGKKHNALDQADVYAKLEYV